MSILKNLVEFPIEKKCVTCMRADDKGRNTCYACGGWTPKPHLVPAKYERHPGPRIMWDPQMELDFGEPK